MIKEFTWIKEIDEDPEVWSLIARDGFLVAQIIDRYGTGPGEELEQSMKKVEERVRAIWGPM